MTPWSLRRLVLISNCCRRREFGFVLEDRDVLADDVRVRATGKSQVYLDSEVDPGNAGMSLH